MSNLKLSQPGVKGSILKFNNFHKQLPVPFVIYADFEAITKKVQGCGPNSDKSYTESYQSHVDCGYGYKVVCHDDKYSKPAQIHRGEKSVYKFMEKMLEEVKYCNKIKKKHFNKDMIMTKKDIKDFKTADKCHICKRKYTDKDIRVRDHCHITGKYRGSAHQECNVNFQLVDKIPVIFHNLCRHDSHFIMQKIGEIAKKHKYKNKEREQLQIPNNMEKYMSFMLGKHLVFLDSFQFLSPSLDKLVSNLPKKALKYTSEGFKGVQLDLMSQKGVYPYDFMDSSEKFKQTELPRKEDFYSILYNERIKDEEYDHAKNVWNTFSLKDMGEYHEFLLKIRSTVVSRCL